MLQLYNLLLNITKQNWNFECSFTGWLLSLFKSYMMWNRMSPCILYMFRLVCDGVVVQ